LTGAVRARGFASIGPTLRGVAIGVVVSVAAGCAIVGWAWSMASQPGCVELQRADLSLSEMVEVKLKVDESERAGSSPLEFSGRETSFLMREVLQLPVFVDVSGDEMVVQAAIAREDYCYNVDFRGEVTVTNGVAVVRPTRVRIGDLDLSRWVNGAWSLGPVLLGDSSAGELMSHLERLEVHADRVSIKVDDVGALR